MYNAKQPIADELPSSAQLLRSTAIAIVAAGVILVTAVLPAEYGIDPTGAGRLLGLTEMGEIKTQLAEEAAADHGAGVVVSTPQATPAEPAQAAEPQTASAPAQQEPVAQPIEQPAEQPVAAQSAEQPAVDTAAAETLPAQPAPQADAAEPAKQEEPAAPVETAEAEPAETAQPAPSAATEPAAPTWRDEVSITLTPGQGVEFKLVMKQGAQARFEWTANGGRLNFDAHGSGSGQRISYEKGRGVPSDEGVLEAAFDGNHGWFWRNRTERDVTLTLRTSGAYSELKRVL